MSHINFPVNTVFGQKIRTAIGDFVRLRADLVHYKSVMDSLIGAAPDYTQLESNPLFNVPAGQGQTFYTNIVNIVANMNAVGNYVYDMDQG